MATDKTYVGKMGELDRLNTAMAANSGELPDLEGTRTKLVALQSQVQDAVKKQAELRAQKQDVSLQLKTAFTESDRLATVVRKHLKAHYGIRAEKLVEFGIQPFRGKAKAVAKPPEPPQSPGTTSAHLTPATDTPTK